MIRVDSNSGKNVLVIVDEIGHIAQCKIRGVSAYARRAGWHLSFGDGRHSGDRPDFAKWIGLWQPDGLIVDAEYLGDVLSLDPSIRPRIRISLENLIVALDADGLHLVRLDDLKGKLGTGRPMPIVL